ncbi:hypothetical protein V8E53_010323 [Lactarius tabidus]
MGESRFSGSHNSRGIFVAALPSRRSSCLRPPLPTSNATCGPRDIPKASRATAPRQKSAVLGHRAALHAEQPAVRPWFSKEVGTFKFVTPKPETVTPVNEWLSANGLNATVLSPFGDWMGFETTVSGERTHRC